MGYSGTTSWRRTTGLAVAGAKKTTHLLQDPFMASSFFLQVVLHWKTKEEFFTCRSNL